MAQFNHCYPLNLQSAKKSRTIGQKTKFRAQRLKVDFRHFSC